MRSQVYNSRLPALRVSSALESMLIDYKERHNISLAAAMRLTMAKGLNQESQQIQVIPLVGKIDEDRNIHFFPEAA